MLEQCGDLAPKGSLGIYVMPWCIANSYMLQRREDEYKNGRISVKKLDPEAADMEIEAEWDEPTKIITTQEEKSAER